MGWNTLTWTPNAPGTEIFADLTPGIYTYFVHSYHCVPAQPTQSIAWTEYEGLPICAAVRAATLRLAVPSREERCAGPKMLSNWLMTLRPNQASSSPLKVEQSA